MGAPRWCWVEGCVPFSIPSAISLDLTMHFGTDMGVDINAAKPRTAARSNGVWLTADGHEHQQTVDKIRCSAVKPNNLILSYQTVGQTHATSLHFKRK